jgi:hypothetical protein
LILPGFSGTSIVFQSPGVTVRKKAIIAEGLPAENKKELNGSAASLLMRDFEMPQSISLKNFGFFARSGKPKTYQSPKNQESIIISSSLSLSHAVRRAESTARKFS